MALSNVTFEIGGVKYDVAKHVTLPHFKLAEDGTPNYFKFLSAIEKGKDLEAGKARKAKDGDAKETDEQMEAPDLMEVLDLATGELGQIIVNAVLKSNLEEKYPNNGYVDKMFLIRKLAAVKKGSRKYYTFEILEIKPKAAGSEAASKPVQSTKK